MNVPEEASVALPEPGGVLWKRRETRRERRNIWRRLKEWWERRKRRRGGIKAG